MLLLFLSVSLVWSEVTFFNVKPVLSIYAQMIRRASVGYYYFYVEVCAGNRFFFLKKVSFSQAMMSGHLRSFQRSKLTVDPQI